MGILGGFYGFKPPSNKCITVIRALTQRLKRTPSSWFLAVYDPACLCNRPNRRNLTLKSFLRCLAAQKETLFPEKENGFRATLEIIVNTQPSMH